MLMDSRVEILHYYWVMLTFSYLVLVRNVSLLITPCARFLVLATCHGPDRILGMHNFIHMCPRCTCRPFVTAKA